MTLGEYRVGKSIWMGSVRWGRLHWKGRMEIKCRLVRLRGRSFSAAASAVLLVIFVVCVALLTRRLGGAGWLVSAII